MIQSTQYTARLVYISCPEAVARLTWTRCKMTPDQTKVAASRFLSVPGLQACYATYWSKIWPSLCPETLMESLPPMIWCKIKYQEKLGQQCTITASDWLTLFRFVRRSLINGKICVTRQHQMQILWNPSAAATKCSHTWSTAAMLSLRESMVVMKAWTLPAMFTAECEPWEYLQYPPLSCWGIWPAVRQTWVYSSWPGSWL